MAEAGATDTEGLADVAEAVEENLEEDEEGKVAALDELNDLRTERAALIERLRIVLDELEAKGGATDEARYYIAAVSGISLDVTDQQAAWAAIIGWLSSEEGGLRIGGNLLKFILILLAAWFISRFISGLLGRALRANRNLTELMRTFLTVAVRRLILAIGLILAFRRWRWTLAPSSR